MFIVIQIYFNIIGFSLRLPSNDMIKPDSKLFLATNQYLEATVVQQVTETLTRL